MRFYSADVGEERVYLIGIFEVGKALDQKEKYQEGFVNNSKHNDVDQHCEENERDKFHMMTKSGMVF